MDFPKRERALPQGSPRRSPAVMRPGAATEADENASPKRTVPAWAASLQRKKVLGERNDGGGGAGIDAAASPPPPQPKPTPSPPTLTGRGAGAYDPKTNYTTPRPEFLRYDPERRREILLRVARAAEVEDDDCSSAASGSAASEDDGGSVASDAEAAASPVSPARRSDSEAELDNSDDEEEEEEDPAPRGRSARRLFLLLVAVACSFCYMCCMNPAAFPVHHSEDGLDFIGPIGGMYDAGDHEADSPRLLGTVYMMGPEDVLEEATSHNWDSEGMIRPYGQSASPRNLVAVTMMGLTDICLNVQLGELTCQIGGESSENGVYLKEDSEVYEHETEVAIISLVSNSTHTTDMEDGSLGLVYQEDGEDHSNQFVQLGSMEKAMESASDKLDDRNCLENEELNLDTKLWQYETAEAAKAICSTVKFLWSAMETHLLQILACLSVVGFVAAMFKYFQRSRKMAAPASRHVSSEPLAEVPVLVPHQIVQVPVSPPQAMQLPVYSSEQPTQLTGPKQSRSGSLEVPMELAFPKPVSLKVPLQKPLAKTDPFGSLKVRAPVHGNCDQKLQQGDANNMEPSNGNFDSSKPPMVELIGEFTFVNSSRRTPIKRMKQYAGDATVQENSVQGEKMDATPAPLTPTPLTPTPLRRSSRLRNKVTSP